VISRRALLAGGAAALLGGARGEAGAQPAPPAAPPAAPLENGPGAQRPLAVERGPLGVTIYTRLAAAPFPAVEEPYTDDTVAIFVPPGLPVGANASGGGSDIDILLHLHGHYNNVRHVLATHRLREQLADAGRSPLLVVPELPFDAEDSAPGRLAEAGGLERLLLEVLEVLREKQVRDALPEAPQAGARPGRVVISAHSGGYKAAGQAAHLGGLDVSEVWFFDALFGQGEVLLPWIAQRRTEAPGPSRHRLVSYHRQNSHTAEQTVNLMAAMDAAGLPYLLEKREGQSSRADFGRARAVFVRTRVPHNEVVYGNGALADCLRSSVLPQTRPPRERDRRRAGKK
jgi:hypothetical protein